MILVIVIPTMKNYYDSFVLFKHQLKYYSKIFIISRSIDLNFFPTKKGFVLCDLSDKNSVGFILGIRKIINGIREENPKEDIVVHSYIFNWPLFGFGKNIYLFTSVLCSKISSLFSNMFFLMFFKKYSIREIFREFWSSFVGALMAYYSFFTSNFVLLASSMDAKYYPLDKKKALIMEVDGSFWRPMDLKKNNKILYVGRFEYKKGTDIVFDLIEKLGDKFHFVLVEGTVKGRRTDPKFARLIKEYKQRYNIDHYKNLDRVNLRKKYNECFISVHPSLFEGFPRVLREAISCGLFCVASDIPGHSIIKPYFKNLFLVEKNEANYYVKKINYLFDNKRSKSTLKNNVCSIEKVASELDLIYSKLINKNKA